MKIGIDGKESNRNFPGKNISQIIEILMDENSTPEKMVAKITINKNIVIPGEEINIINIDDINIIEITTMPPIEMVFSLIDNAINAISQVKPALDKVVEMLRENREMEASANLMPAIDVLRFTFGGILGIQTWLDEEINIESKSKDAFNLMLENFEPLAQEIVSSFQQTDWVLLADLMEYEMPALIEEATEILVILKKEVSSTKKKNDIKNKIKITN